MSLLRARSSSRLIPSVLACGLVVGSGLAGAAPASASSWEQISRGNGAQGATYFSNDNTPVFASDTGRFGIVQPVPFVAWNRQGQQAPTNLRDVVANTTRTIAKPLSRGHYRSERVLAATADESKLLVRTSPAAGGAAYAARFVLRPVAGGADVPVTTAIYDDPSSNDATLSGDGSTVAVVDDGVLKIVDVASGAVEQQHPDLWAAVLDANSFSDDGKVLAGALGTTHSSGFYVVDGQVTIVDDGAVQVSPDGSKLYILVYDPTTGSPLRLDVLRLSDHTTRSYPLPVAGVGEQFLWISPDGTRVAVTPNGRDAGVPFRFPVPAPPVGQSWVLNIASGTWAKFGREFSASLNTGSKVSRNGKYAVVEYRRNHAAAGSVEASQAALVDLTGSDLPGTTEALSASSYLTVSPPVSYGGDGTLYAAFGRPAPWAPLPRKGELTVTIDGTTALHRTFSSPTTADVQIPYPVTAKSVTIDARVVDYLGRTLTTQQTIPVRFYIDEP